ncbi:MAG: hypothetical protein H0X34_20270 [Chthoniobacterales bacterium]|nr:hypothetical protein [Chthoniobacterales bacterium]
MILRSLFAAASIVVVVTTLGRAYSETPSPPPTAKLAPYKERLAKAESVKVQTDILGIGIDSSLEAAHAVLDSLCDVAHRPKEEADEAKGEGEHIALWQLAKTDFGSVNLKADDKERVTYIAASLRAGKEIPFDKIGEVGKAPIQTDEMVAWDVVRPKRPLIRVIACGSEGKANSIIIILVKRAPDEK